MSPGELAMFLALFRVLSEEGEKEASGFRTFALHRLVPKSATVATFCQVFDAIERQGFSYFLLGENKRAALAVIDRAIIEAEALEDMGAVRVLP